MLAEVLLFFFDSSQSRSCRKVPAGPGVGWRPTWCISGVQERPWSVSVCREGCSRPSCLVSTGAEVWQADASLDSVLPSRAPRFSSIFAVLLYSEAIR